MKTLIIRLFKKKSLTDNHPIWISLIILVAGLFITVFITNYAKQIEESNAQKGFVQVCSEIKSKIIIRVNMQKEFLISGSSLFEASETVTRDEWKNFNKYSGNNVKFMGVQGLGFSTLIQKENLKNHISAIQKEGFPNYKVFPPGIRDSYTSVIYLEPFRGRNILVFGYDMFSDPILRKAMEISRDKNEPALSGKVYLRIKSKEDRQAGTLMFVPVYKNVPINTIAERREAIIGWVFSAFRMNDLVKSTLETQFLNNQKNLHLQIYEGGSIVPKALLFDSRKNKTESHKENKISTRILPVVFNNKKWTLVLSQYSENTFFISAQIALISMGGMTISLLLSALSYTVLITKKRAKKIAERLSLDLLIKNQEYERMNKSLNKNYKRLIASKGKLKDTNVELEKAKIKAEESDKLKSAFLANMSHEIRTPMNGIMGFAELLKSGNLSPEENKNYIRIIEKSGTRLLSIINDIVDISKIEAGQMKVSYSTTNIDKQMQYIHTFFGHEAQDKGIQLILKKSSHDQETIISSDREKLYAILINLVKNAIKYTVKGTIEFGYEKKGKQIEFFVKDTGIGISKDRQNAVFERFIQADFNDKMARQGAGLGLAIAKAYVELLGGKIWVESEIGKGSEFYFSVPNTIQLEEKDVAQQILSIPEKPCEIKNLKILVTEDDNISRMLILKVLQGYSNKILIAQTGVEAVEICQKNPDLDLILMDIQMPQMNGYEATKEIRKFNSTVIILAQTAYALEGDKAKTIAVGCNDYISKPIKKIELSNLLQHYFCKQENLN